MQRRHGNDAAGGCWRRRRRPQLHGGVCGHRLQQQYGVQHYERQRKREHQQRERPHRRQSQPDRRQRGRQSPRRLPDRLHRQRRRPRYCGPDVDRPRRRRDRGLDDCGRQWSFRVGYRVPQGFPRKRTPVTPPRSSASSPTPTATPTPRRPPKQRTGARRIVPLRRRLQGRRRPTRLVSSSLSVTPLRPAGQSGT